MTVIDWLRKLWFNLFVRAPLVNPQRIGACRKFVPDPTGTFPNVYCRVCGYDKDVHRGHPDHDGFDFVVRGRRYIVGYNTERKRWGIHREKTFTALLCWPLIVGIGKQREVKK